jgi:hypothetical protein
MMYRQNTKRIFAIVDQDGDVFETVEHGSVDDAIEVAEEIGGERTDIYVDGTATAEAEARPNIRRLNMVEVAVKKMRLEPINDREFDRILSMSIESAFARIKPFFANLPLFTGPKRVERWDNANTAVEGLLGGNEKLSKKDPDARLGNAKLFAGEKHREIVMSGLSLLPHSLAFGGESSVGNFCVSSSASCRKACLVYSGHNNADYARALKEAKSKAFIEENHAFIRMLIESIRQRTEQSRCMKQEPFFRLNVYSDIPWELFCSPLFRFFGDVQFYDYTKVPGRVTPRNYDLTFSDSGVNEDNCISELESGRRVAVVLLNRKQKEEGTYKKGQSPYLYAVGSKKAPLPEEWYGHRVVNGDLSDARPLDPVNAIDDEPCIVGLRYKPAMGVKSDMENISNMSLVHTYERNPEPGALIVLGVQERDGWYTVADTPGMTPLVGWNTEL